MECFALFRSIINELVDENRCKVYDNGREIDFKYYSDNNTLTFTLGKGWHNVGIVLVDMAGNVNNIQEIRNIHVGFFLAVGYCSGVCSINCGNSCCCDS